MNGSAVFFCCLRQYRTVLVVQLRRQIFRQCGYLLTQKTEQIEEARVTPLLTKFVKSESAGMR